MGKTHMIAGGAAYATFCVVTKTPVNPGAFSLAIVGSLLPDIDHEYSTISQESGLALVSKGIQAIFGHRTITHSLFFLVGVALLSLPLWRWAGFDWWFALWGCGVLSHFITDSMTVSGMPWFYPFSKKDHGILPHMLRIHTGSWVEMLFSIGLLGVFLFVGYVAVGTAGAALTPFTDNLYPVNLPMPWG